MCAKRTSTTSSPSQLVVDGIGFVRPQLGEYEYRIVLGANGGGRVLGKLTLDRHRRTPTKAALGDATNGTATLDRDRRDV